MYDDEEYSAKFYRDMREVYDRCRGAGQTTALEYIASVTPDAVIVVRDQQHKQQLRRMSASDGPALVTVNDLPKYLLGNGRQILFWDNYAVLRIVERSADWVKGLTNQTYWLRTRLHDTESEISRLNAAHREALRYADAKASADSLLERDIADVERARDAYWADAMDFQKSARINADDGRTVLGIEESALDDTYPETAVRCQRAACESARKARIYYERGCDCAAWVVRAKAALGCGVSP